MKYLVYTVVIMWLLLGGLNVPVLGQEKQILAPDTPDEIIINMDPKMVDPSQLPLDSVEDLHVTGTTQHVDLATWRLQINGKAVTNELSLSYDDLLQMDMITKKSILICPGFFVDYAEWTGIPIQAFLNQAGVENYEKIIITTVDGYSTTFSQEEIDGNLIFLALKVNGVDLPPEHGFPARIVADGLFGGRWVKWVNTIEVL
jgi:DMSO/TMAO reductase YedYZ molybdopterin-dependent catalytic subunit